MPQAAEQEELAPIESSADAETRTRAEGIGWTPPERYRGPPERFIDADEFIRRGEEILPIVRKQKQDLETKVTALSSETEKLKAIIAKNQETMEALEEFHTTETKRRVEQVRRELKTELANASREGNHEAVAELTEQMTQLNEKVEEEEGRPPKPKPAEAAPTTVVGIDPVLSEWAKDTGWYLQPGAENRRKTAEANNIAMDLREAGSPLQGVEFLREVQALTEAKFSGGGRPSADKTNGNARPGGGARNNGAKGYSSLPAEAKAACAEYEKDSRLVGEGRRHKDVNSFRAAYAATYFESES